MPIIFRGLPACECLAEWLPPFEAELKARGLIKVSIDIAQLIGMADASALVHSTGGAADLWQTDWRVSWVARRMGAMSWPRVLRSFARNQHTHLVLIGCPHLHQQGLDQIAEGLRGGDGLLGDYPDDARLVAALVPGRTWRDGIAWQKRQARRRALTRMIQAGKVRLEKWKAERADLRALR